MVLFEHGRISAASAALLGVLFLSACDDGGNGAMATAEKINVERPTTMASKSAQAATEVGVTACTATEGESKTMTTIPAAIDGLLGEGTSLPLARGTLMLERSADSLGGSVLDARGARIGHAALLVRNRSPVALSEENGGETYVFIPYYESEGGTAYMLTIGLYRYADGVLEWLDARVVDDRAAFDEMCLRHDGWVEVRGRTRYGNQKMWHEPTAPMEVLFRRDGTKLGKRGFRLLLPRMSVNGLGPIFSDSRYVELDDSIFTAHGYEVSRIDEGMGELSLLSFLTLTGKTGAVTATYIKDGPLLSIVSSDPEIAGELGVRIGAPFEDNAETMLCGPGLEEFSGDVLCSRPDVPHLAVLFHGPMPDNVPDGWMPEASDPLASEWRATNLLWLSDIEYYRQTEP